MKNNACLVCKKEFYGRNNQIFCSSECKNRHNNLKTRLIYRNGKPGSEEISQIQADIYTNNERIQRISDIFNKETAIYKAEIAVLKSDYTDLLKKYERFKNELEKIRKKYYDAQNSMVEMEEQIKLLGALGEMFVPAINKVVENLTKTKKDESPL